MTPTVLNWLVERIHLNFSGICDSGVCKCTTEWDGEDCTQPPSAKNVHITKTGSDNVTVQWENPPNMPHLSNEINCIPVIGYN